MTLSVRLFTSAAFAGIAFTSALRADDWPSWGGSDPGRNMYSPAKGFPSQFDPGKFKKNSEEIDLSHDEEREVGREARLADLRQPGRRERQDARRHEQRRAARPALQGRQVDPPRLDEYTGDFLWQFVVPKLASGKVNDWEYLGILPRRTSRATRSTLVTSRCEVVALEL